LVRLGPSSNVDRIPRLGKRLRAGRTRSCGRSSPALAAADINGVITGVRSLSESFAETNGGLEQSTIDTLGYLTIDSYPDQDFVPCNGGSGSCDPTYATDAASAWSTQLGHIVSDQQAARGNSSPVPILIGEAGYSNCDPTGGSNCAGITDQQQANVLADEYNAFEPYDIQGLNLWVPRMSSGYLEQDFPGMARDDETGTWPSRFSTWPSPGSSSWCV